MVPEDGSCLRTAGGRDGPVDTAGGAGAGTGLGFGAGSGIRFELDDLVSPTEGGGPTSYEGSLCCREVLISEGHKVHQQ